MDPTKSILEQAIEQTERDLRDASPIMRDRAWKWIIGLYAPHSVSDAMKHPLAFPIFLLPWWLERSLDGQIDPEFQLNLMQSTFCGYHFIRLIDNFMDGDAEVDRNLLPVLGYFHTRFHAPYQRHFSAQDNFWKFFDTCWMESCSSALADADLERIGSDEFMEIASRKTVAALIPMGAVCYKYDRLDLLPACDNFIKAFSCYHQFQNDMRDWRKDFSHSNRTYFIERAEVTRHDLSDLESWVRNEGLDWGREQLRSWLVESTQHASSLGSSALTAYLEFRRLATEEVLEDLVLA